jgi:predicted nucleotidyltransferase
MTSGSFAAALSGITEGLKRQVGERLLTCYVTGSYADGSAGSGSDLDLLIVFRGEASEADKNEVRRVIETLGETFAVSCDIEMMAEASARTSTDPILKWGSQLLFGEDIRDSVTPMPIDEWARDRLHTSYWRTVNLFGRSIPVTLPLNYPAPDDEFFGYVISGSTRTLMRHVSWAATALIAQLGQQYVIRKADFVAVYQAAVGDYFTSYLNTLYTACKLEWDYQIPADPAPLRELCRQTLDFEKHFLDIYKRFIVDELMSGSASAKTNAVQILTLVPFDDAQVQAALSSAN